MAKYMLKLPSMGESVTEATLTAWLKEVGDTIEIDDSIVEVSTDKVDSDVPSEVEGVLLEKRFELNQVIQVGEVIAVIETDQEIEEIEVTPEIAVEEASIEEEEEEPAELTKEIIEIVEAPVQEAVTAVSPQQVSGNDSTRFYSPLVKNIAKTEGISFAELDRIPGTGEANRLTKKDLLAYLEQRATSPQVPVSNQKVEAEPSFVKTQSEKISVASGEDQVIEMSRMAKMISHHMTESKNTSVHVQSFVEADVTELWDWREKVKNQFQAKEGEKLTFTPIFIS
ncbi:MAG: biotin/lipoyl-containing protein, partial [Flavobacteriaceae bacterium]